MLRLQLRDLAGHPLRTAGVVALVTVCSALVVAVVGLVQSVAHTAERVGDQAAGTADVEVASAFSGTPVPEETVATVERVDGVAAVAPTVETAVAVDGERAVLLASDARALAFLPDRLSDALVAELGPQAAAGRPLLSAPLAEELGVGAGDTVRVRAPDAARRVEVGGILPDGAAQGSLVIADLATGLRLRGGGEGGGEGYDRLLVDLVDPGPGAQRTGGGGPGASGSGSDSDPDPDPGPASGPEEARHALRQALDGRAVLLEPERRAAMATDALRPVVQPLVLLATVVVVVAGVLVFNVVSVAVAERRRHLAIQCALGARRRRLWLALVGEAAALGALGGGLGATLGRRVTSALVDQVPAALVNAALPTRIQVDVPAWLLVGGVAVGVVAAGTAAATAGLPVLRLSPLEAMGPREVAGEPAPPVRVAGTAVAVLCLAAGGVAVAVAPPRALTPAALTMLIGVIALVWALRGPLARGVALVARRAGAPGLLAALAVARSPARNATTVLGALLPVTAIVTLGGIDRNIYDTAERNFAALDEVDWYVTGQAMSEVDDRRLPAGLDREVAAIEGVERVVASRFVFARIGGGEVLVEGVGEGTTAPLLRLSTPEARRRLHAPPGRGDVAHAIVSDGFARRMDLDVGDRFRVPTATGRAAVEVADVIGVTSWPGGLIAVSYERLAAWSGVEAPSLLEVDVRDPGPPGAGAAGTGAAGATGGADPARALADLLERYEERGMDGMVLTSGDRAVDEALLSIRQSQALFSALQVVLVLAGAFAIVSTLVISTLGRTRELGLLRAVGAQRRLVRRAVVVEAFVVTGVGAVAGVVVGTLFQFVGVQLAARSAGFAADFALTPRPGLTALVGGVAIAGAAAVVTLRRVLHLDVLDAIAYE